MGRPLSGDIVALLRRALREGEYSAAEHLLQALEELENPEAAGQQAARCSCDLDIAYLEIARTLPAPPIGRGKESAVTESAVTSSASMSGTINESR